MCTRLARPLSPRFTSNFSEQGRVLQICALLSPLVKGIRGVMRRQEVMYDGKTVGVLKGKRAQQQPVHNAEYAGVRANTYRQGGDGECRMPGAACPESKSEPDVLQRFRGKLHRNRYRQIAQEPDPESDRMAESSAFSHFVAELPFQRSGIAFAKPWWIESQKPAVQLQGGGGVTHVQALQTWRPPAAPDPAYGRLPPALLCGPAQ